MRNLESREWRWMSSAPLPSSSTFWWHTPPVWIKSQLTTWEANINLFLLRFWNLRGLNFWIFLHYANFTVKTFAIFWDGQNFAVWMLQIYSKILSKSVKLGIIEYCNFKIEKFTRNLNFGKLMKNLLFKYFVSGEFCSSNWANF